jgi:3-hydroxyisobutyrate dehydrogenase
MTVANLKVGLVGLGNMGWGMAANVAKHGFDLTVYDTDAVRARRFAGEHAVRAAASVAELAACEVIVTMLPTGRIVREVLTGEGGLAASLAAGTIVVDMSSSEPTGTRELGAQLKERGIVLIDAPVSGGKLGAEAGTLSIMVGSDDAAALERVMPLLNAMGKRIFQSGSLGCGHAVKALNNYVAASAFAATAEALLIGERFGLDLGTTVDIMNVSTGRNFFTDLVMKEHVVGGRFATGFAIGLLAKDVRIAAELGEAVGQHAPLLELVNARWSAARDAIGEQRDNSEAYLVWKKSAA